MPDDEALRPTMYRDLGVQLFPPVPEDFDPVEASDAGLMFHGYPSRPDPQVHPERYDHWKRIVSGSISRIEPRFGPAPIDRPPIGPMEMPPEPFPTRGTTVNWSGSVGYPRGFAMSVVAGGWTVPAVTEPPVVLGGQSGGVPVCAAWIGIDGWTEENSLATDILQAGTTQMVGRAPWAWWEWKPADPVSITNLVVSPGDVMYCVIRARSPIEANFYLVNETTGTAVVFSKSAPGATQLVGATAEWIVELPAGTFNGQPLELANFGSVTFDHCIAYGTDEPTLVYPGPGELITMDSAIGYTLATPTVLADDSIRIDWSSGQISE